MRTNVSLNALKNVEVAKLDWFVSLVYLFLWRHLTPMFILRGTELPDNIPRESDLILAADCVYFEPAFPLLVSTLCALAGSNKTPEILFCYKKRRKASQGAFHEGNFVINHVLGRQTFLRPLEKGIYLGRRRQH